MLTYNMVMEAINEALDSVEFRAVIARKIFDKVSPKLPSEPEDQSMVETLTGLDANFGAVGLANLFHSKLLGRRPTSQEDLPSLVGFMQSMINEGIKGKLIFDTIQARGRNAESIWDFRKRVYAAHIPTVSNPYAKMEAHAEAEIRRREAMA